MTVYIRSKPISVGVSIIDRLNYIAYIIGKGIKYLHASPFHGLWQFYLNIDLQRQKTATCTILQKQLTGFFVCLFFFLKSKTTAVGRKLYLGGGHDKENFFERHYFLRLQKPFSEKWGHMPHPPGSYGTENTSVKFWRTWLNLIET